MSQDVEHWIAGHQGGRVAVRPEAEMDEVEYRRRAGDYAEGLDKSQCRSFQVGGFHRHRVDLFGAYRGVLEQAVAQMGQVAVGMPLRRHTLVDLGHMHPAPRNIFACEVAKHDPWGMAAAYRKDEAAARREGGAGFCRDDRGTLSGDRLGIGEDFDFHSSL
jgi:hypothetical protein